MPHSNVWWMHSAVGLVIFPCIPWGKEFPSLGLLPEILHYCILVCISFLVTAMAKASASAAGRRVVSHVVGTAAGTAVGWYAAMLHLLCLFQSLCLKRRMCPGTFWVDAWGRGLTKEGKEGPPQVQTAFPREPWCTSSPGSVFHCKVLCQGAAVRAKLCS